MKITKVKSQQTKLTETRFDRNRAFDDHFDKHVAKDWRTYFLERQYELLPPMEKSQYDEAADLLTKQQVITSDIESNNRYVGFVTESGRILKYDKTTYELVLYVCNSTEACTITYYHCGGINHARYKRIFNREYAREITPEDDMYNI